MQPLLRLISSLITITVLTTGCSHLGISSKKEDTLALPSITDTPSGQTLPGKFIWHDLLTPDLKLAGKFYEELFGWEIEYKQQYAIIRNNNKLIAGIMQVSAPDEHSREGVWLPSISTDNVDTAIIRAKERGGIVLNGPIDIKERGRGALISDPQKADFVLLNAKDGDPTDTEAAIGDWLWDEIWTNDPDNTEDFYQSVFGYDETDWGDRYDILIHKGKIRAGIRHVPDDAKHMLWVPVIRVADPKATSLQAKKLGGEIWITVDEAPGNGNTALISDTTGALFLIQRWPTHPPKGDI